MSCCFRIGRAPRGQVNRAIMRLRGAGRRAPIPLVERPVGPMVGTANCGPSQVMGEEAHRTSELNSALNLDEFTVGVLWGAQAI